MLVYKSCVLGISPFVFLFVCVCGRGARGGGVTAHQDYFTHFKSSQSLGGVKTGDPRGKHQTTHKQDLAGLTCDQSSARTDSGEVTE